MTGLTAVKTAGGWDVDDAPSPSTSSATTVLGLVTNRNLVPTKNQPLSSLGAGTNSARSFCSQVAMDDITAVRVICPPNWAVVTGATGEQDMGGTSTWGAAFEGPDGTRTQLTFSGAATATAADGQYVKTDIVQLAKPVKRFDRIGVHLNATYTGSNIALTDNEQNEQSDGSSARNYTDFGVNLGGTLVSGYPSANPYNFMVCPVAVLGYTARGACVLIGTSITQGQLDQASDWMLLKGISNRAVGQEFACINFGGGGATAQTDNSAARWTRRLALLAEIQNIKCAVSDYGTNDAFNNRTVAQFVADMSGIKTILGGLPIIQGCVLPRTTLNTNTLNSAFQTLRLAYNLQIASAQGSAAAPALFAGYYDYSSIFEDPANPGTWLRGVNVTGSDTNDGTHPIRSGNTRITQDPWRLLLPVRRILGS